jgi:hypothetical protein
MADSLFQVLPKFLSEAERHSLLTLIESATSGWEVGRQATGYDKFSLLQQHLSDQLPELVRALLSRTLEHLDRPPEGFYDVYLLRYSVGDLVPPHVDPPMFDGAIHLRLNALITQAQRGGRLWLADEAISLETGDAVIFRPDALRHSVERVEAGTRYVWSVGCNRPLG